MKCGKRRKDFKNRTGSKIAIGSILGIVIIGLFVLYSDDFNSVESITTTSKDIVQDVADNTIDLIEGIETVSENSVTQNTVDRDSLPDIVFEPSIQNTRENTSTTQKTDVNRKPIINIRELEFRVHELTNEYRIENNIPPLDYDHKLADIARQHSVDMGIHDYFEHDNLEGQSPTDRAILHNYNCHKKEGRTIYTGIAENIFQNWTYSSYSTINDIITSYDWNDAEKLANEAVDGWMDSPGHRENILTPSYTKEGIGVSIVGEKVFFTQNFC